ncbi:MAG: glucans biosynthesis glucosyltransferase MdoH [Desulfovibrionaceae bacterium]
MHGKALATDREDAGRRLVAYLRHLPLEEEARLQSALDIVRELPAAPPGEAAGEAMRRLFAAGHGPDPDAAPRAAMPIERTSMSPERFGPRSLLSRLFEKAVMGGRPPRTSTLPREYLNQPWRKVAFRRRLALTAFIVGLSAFAAPQMASVLPHKGAHPLEMALVAVFTILFAWTSLGFWTAVAGFFTILRRVDRYAVTRKPQGETPHHRPVRTALLFPVYNEDMDRVCAGIEAVYRSLERTGQGGDFDIHILSDTQAPDAWVEEEAAWARLVARCGATGRVFYRRRRMNIKKKSGNVGDFCRRYGARYTYMVVMDADSIMTGETLVRLVGVMERKRHVGILQTVPIIFGRETFLARLQQFAARIYGPLFAAGLHYWFLGDAQFWGHNAIIRTKPFMRHCALPRLTGRPPLGGDILSHDFVEAALMRRAGWGVWLAYDLPGSYEECPPNLLTELSRDRRWCKGNLQHLRLVFTRGVFPAHRALFLNGVLAYGSALLWFLFLAVSSIEAVMETFIAPTYFPASRTLFPQWPVWEPWWSLSVLATTGVLLFLPKVLGFLSVAIKGRSREFGGLAALGLGILLEVLVSICLAPIRMLFHSKFVLFTLLGMETQWQGQQRDDTPTSWGEAIRFHLGGTVMSLVWGMALFACNRTFFMWVLPIFLPAVCAIPLSVLTSRPGIGRALRGHGLLAIPEEVDPPGEIRELGEIEHALRSANRPLGIAKGNGFALAACAPDVCAVHLRQLHGHATPAAAARNRAAMERALDQGPDTLSAQEKKAILSDAATLAALHRAVWTLPGDTLRRLWGVRGM